MIAMLPVVTPEPTRGATGPEGLRERKKREARQRIVDAAHELFASRGFDDTTVADVARAADVSPATVARYFPSKEGLLFSERDQRIDRLARAIVERPRRESPAAAVVAALRDQPQIDAAGQRRLLRSRQAIARSSVLRGCATTLLGEWRDAIADAAVARGADPIDGRVLAVAVVAVLDDTTDRWAADGGRADLQDEIDRAFRALRRTRSIP